MCRISAIISKNNNLSTDDIRSMSLSMAHGGPDGMGLYISEDKKVALGHRRLSIIDLSNAGHQPMANLNNNLQITYNGEIYNYLTLRKELEDLGYKFKSNTDTEVILNAYHAWKENVLYKINGMFAFVIYDIHENKIFAARDNEGIKPLYYSQVGDKIYFASELRSFKAVNNNWEENINWHTLFLTFGFIPEPQTILKDVYHLTKGKYLEIFLNDFKIKENTIDVKNYEHNIFELEAAILEVRKSVQQSVEDQLISDVPIGVFLSGGLDSSIIATIAQKKHKNKLKTLSIYFDDEKYNEKYYQNLVINKTGVNHSSFKVTNKEFKDSIDDILNAMDQPTLDGVNTYFISKYAKKENLKVVLSGLGADEYFGGYNTFENNNKIKKFKKILEIYALFTGNYAHKKYKFLEQTVWYKDHLFQRGVFTPSDISKIINISEKEVCSILHESIPFQDIQHLSSFEKISFLESNIYMRNQLLRDSDIFSMWHGIELRVPFLDTRLVTLINQISPNIRFNKSLKKHLLIEAFKDDLPVEIWDRKKQGFGFPFENWYKDNKYLYNSNFVSKLWAKKFENKKLNYSRFWGIFLEKNFNQLKKF
jgi:asparagine synthase (glutamine-hydrolysing)